MKFIFLVILIKILILNKVKCERNWYNDDINNNNDNIRDTKTYDDKVYFPGDTNEVEVSKKRLVNDLNRKNNFITENNSNYIDDDIVPSNKRGTGSTSSSKGNSDLNRNENKNDSSSPSLLERVMEIIHNLSEDSDEKKTQTNSLNSNQRKPAENDLKEKTNRKQPSNVLRVCEKKYAEYIKRIFPEETDTASDANDTEFNGRVLAAPGEYPHMTAVGFRSKNGNMDYNCGGSLISERFVITAAHCTNFTGLLPDKVRIGDLNLMVEESYLEPQIREIKRIHVHPAYKTTSYYNDIALLELEEEVELTEFVRPIRLWTQTTIPFTIAYAMGYGATAFAKERTNRLTNLNMTIIPNDVCNSEMPQLPETDQGIIDSLICAKDYKLNRDTCQGDSGGPLQLNIKGKRRKNRLHYQLIGITSYGLYCRSGFPSIFTRVFSYLDWIEHIVWRDDFD